MSSRRDLDYKLKNGEKLVVKILEPPLGEYKDKVEYWWSKIKERVLNGELERWSFNPFFVGEIKNEVVGSINYTVPRDIQDVGVVGMVSTKPEHRRKGVASCLMQTLIKTFIERGGLALYLCVTNPIAFKLYQKCGFKPYIGDGMRYLLPGNENFDKTYLSFCGKATIRDAHWGDVARCAVLYNYPLPKWLIKDYPRKVFKDIRFESHFVKIMKNVEDNKGCFLVLENPQKRVVGSACLTEMNSFYEQHIKTLDFYIHPSYLNQAQDLIQAALKKAKESRTGIIQAYLAACDEKKIERDDLLIYGLELVKKNLFLKDLSFYYGGRPQYLKTSEFQAC